ncbi:MAG: hypothetical protein GY881_02895 [Gammaproteobacteria bacterium]|nr:hypothetical protein [Gammaproteobacteria bacterium]
MKNLRNISQARALKNVAPVTRVQGKSGQTIGGVSQNVGGGRFDLGVNEPFGYTHTAAAAEIVKIGDPTGAIASRLSKSATVYDSGTAYTNAILNELLRNPVSIDTINYEVAATADFASSFEYASANLGGSYAARPINSSFTMSKRNTQQNSLLLTAEWPEGLVLGPGSCLFHTVDTTTVTVTMQPRDIYEV